MILFWHQKMETIVMKCYHFALFVWKFPESILFQHFMYRNLPKLYCFCTLCIEICQNDTVSAPKNCNKLVEISTNKCITFILQSNYTIKEGHAFKDGKCLFAAILQQISNVPVGYNASMLSRQMVHTMCQVPDTYKVSRNI